MNSIDALRLALPGIAKCQPLSEADVLVMSKKAEARDLIARLGFSTRRAARELSRRQRVTESTLRGWLKPQALDRSPPDWALEFLRDLVEGAALRERASILETGS